MNPGTHLRDVITLFVCLLSAEITLEQFFNYKFNYKLSKVPLTYWEFVSHWLEDVKTKDNCLILFYETLCENYDAVAEQIRSFLGTTLTTAEKEKVKHLSSFEYMKANESKFDLHGLRHKIHELAGMHDYYIEKSETPSFLNLGAKRDSKTHIPAELLQVMSDEWHTHITSKFGYKSYDELRHALGHNETPSSANQLA